MRTRAEEIAEQMSKQMRSTMVYFESCAVDQGGLVEGKRMNAEDLDNAKVLGAGARLAMLHRIPAALLGKGPNKDWTHYVELTDEGWQVAAVLRKRRAEQHGPYAMSVSIRLCQMGKLK